MLKNRELIIGIGIGKRHHTAQPLRCRSGRPAIATPGHNAAIALEGCKGIGTREDLGHTAQPRWCRAAIASVTPGNDGAIALESCKGIISGEDLGHTAQPLRCRPAPVGNTPSNDGAIALEGGKGMVIREDLANTA